jgi:hypothetical protein
LDAADALAPFASRAEKPAELSAKGREFVCGAEDRLNEGSLIGSNVLDCVEWESADYHQS